MLTLFENFKKYLSVLGAILLAVLGIFYWGKKSVPTKLTCNEVEKTRKEVKDEQKDKDIFQKLDDLDDSLNRP